MQMSSRVIYMLPFEQVDVKSFQQPYKVNEETIARKMQQAANASIQWSQGDPISCNDVAVCKLCSALTKFNRDRVTFTVGSGLFDRELETALIGKNAGDVFTIYKTEDTVEITVLSVYNKRIPELTDAIVSQLGIEGVTTLAQYRAYLIEEDKNEIYEKKAYEATNAVMMQVLSGSDILIKKEDWEKQIGSELHKLRVLVSTKGMELEQMQGDDWEGYAPVSTYFEYLSLIQDGAWRSLSVALLGMELAKTTGFVPSQEAYEAYVKDTVSIWGDPEEVVRESDPFAFFEVASYGEHYFNALDAFVRKNFFVEE